MRRPSAPVVASALTGFVCGVFLTLIATGALVHQSAAQPAPPTPAPVTVIPQGQMKARLDRALARVLGPLPSDPKKSRLVAVHVYPVAMADVGPAGVRTVSGYRTVEVVWRMNNHPFGKAWRLRAAQADVFAILKAIYTAPLTAYDVQLIGTYPLDPKHPDYATPALRAYLAYSTAIRIPWKRWGREDEARVWRLLTSRSVDPRFG